MTRSVAEIIGFSDGHRMGDTWCVNCGMTLEMARSGRCPNSSGPQPAADDLLAWLRERSVHRIEMHYSKGWADVIVGDTYHEAPTLLAALEMAVRAVAGES